MAVDIFTVVLVGKLIEPLWGALEMMTFFFIINTGNVLSMLFEVNLLMVNIHRCCCPLCDFLLPPLHDHRECRPLISGSKSTLASRRDKLTHIIQVHIHGLSGYLAGVSIAVKQVMPDHVLAR